MIKRVLHSKGTAVLFLQFVLTAEYPSLGFPCWKLGARATGGRRSRSSRIAVLLGSRCVRPCRKAHGLLLQPRGT
jgi:hypothetical protein